MLQVAGFTSLSSLLLLSMSSNRLGDKATFGLPDLSQLAPPVDSPAQPITATVPSAVMFPLLQVLRLHDNSIRSIHSLQLYGYTGNSLHAKLVQSFCCLAAIVHIP